MGMGGSRMSRAATTLNRFGGNKTLARLAGGGSRFAAGSMGSLAGGLGLGIAGLGADVIRGNMKDPESTGGKLLGVGSSALKGAGIGMMFGPWGAAIGGVLGGLYGAYDEFIAKGEDANQAVDNVGIGDGLFRGSKKSRRAILEGKNVTPIDNKDDILAMKPGGIVDKAMSQSTGVNTVKHEFGELNISGEITLNVPGNEKININLAKNPEFVREITKMVNIEVVKIKNQIQKG
jgi:hypothetical protein